MMMGEESRVMESCIRATVEALHSSPFQAVLYLTGGASQVSPLSLSLYICMCVCTNGE